MLIIQYRRRVRKDGSWTDRVAGEDGELPDGTWQNDERMCTQPLLPVVFQLNGLAKASSSSIAQTAAVAAAFGIGWADPDWPSFAACGYDLVPFGNGVLDYAYRNDWDVQMVLDEGRRALDLMTSDLLKAISHDGPQSAFTPAPGENGTP